jgi:hypothetical protein
MPLEHGCASVAAAKHSEGFVVGRFLDAPRQGCKRSVYLATLRRIACQASARDLENERPRQSQALDITKALERASLVPGLQHFHKLGLPATFPPTECQMAAASYLCV